MLELKRILWYLGGFISPFSLYIKRNKILKCVTNKVLNKKYLIDKMHFVTIIFKTCFEKYVK